VGQTVRKGEGCLSREVAGRRGRSRLSRGDCCPVLGSRSDPRPENAPTANGPVRLRCALVRIAMLVAVSGCSQVEPEAVCDRLGSFHRLGRSELESLRARELISAGEWRCMADALAGLDHEISRRCVTTPQYLDAVQDSQRKAYSACLTPPRDSFVEAAVVRSLPGP
jgi:hypothetical protein